MESHLVTDGHTYSADYWHEMPAPQVGWEVLVQQPHIIEVGDIVHVQGGSIYSRAIRWFTGGGIFDHTALGARFHNFSIGCRYRQREIPDIRACLLILDRCLYTPVYRQSSS